MFQPGASERQPGPSAQLAKTGTLQQSENYIWNTADVLGRGATAVVYFGRHKVLGDVCAVKVFHERESRHLLTTRRREIEALTSIQHKNIVKLLGLEREGGTNHEVLVMEYCSGGSLYNMLEQPHYAYGFPEEEFLLFLSHTTSGMRYLRQCGFIHRDIKPGNIMRFIGEDGRSVYKITDFGAARELQDDETFMSIYGTEEYLFPEMYATAVLRKPTTMAQTFDASVDIWSIGVTIYHVCTGQLPFQPFGGRRNAETMHAITSQKPSGIISGIQSSMNGAINWSSTLPSTCLLSEMLQEMIVSILAGLLENDGNKMWSFDRFFDAVTAVDTMVVVKVFHCWTGQQLIVYLQRGDTLPVLQERLAKLTDIHAGDQLIMWTDKELCDVIDTSKCVSDYPRSVRKAQLFLVSRSCLDSYGLKPINTPAFPEISELHNLETDAQTAKKANAVAHFFYVAVDLVLKEQVLLQETELHFRRFVKTVVFRFQVLIPELKKALAEADKRQNTFHTAYKSVIVLFETLKHLVDVGVLSFSREDAGKQLIGSFMHMAEFLNNTSLKEFSEKIRYRLEEIVVYVGVLSTKINEQERDRMHCVEGCTDDDHCISKVENLKQKINTVAGIMSKHRKYKDLHSHEEFIHKCEKQKLQEHCVALMSLYQDHCFKNLKNVYGTVMRHISILTKHLTRTKKVEQNMISVNACLEQLSDRIGEEEQKCKRMVDKITNILKETLVQGSGFMLKDKTVLSTEIPSEIKQLSSSSKVMKYSGEESHSVSHKTGSDFRTQPGGLASSSAFVEKTRSELASSDSLMSRTGVGQTSKTESCSVQKKARTELLDQLNQELSSLQNDSSSLNRLILENSQLMQMFLTETSNLRIDGSLDSRGVESEVT